MPLSSTFISLREPVQRPYLAIEQAPQDETEATLLHQVRAFIQAVPELTDLRDLAPQVRQLLGTDYQVFSGGAHTAIHRQVPGSPRLAIIADAHTTAYRDWNVPAPQVAER